MSTIKLPSDPKAFAALDLRLGQEMARCARDYDDARQHLVDHHAKMTSKALNLTAEIDSLRPSVDAFLDNDGGCLTRDTAKTCIKYLELNAQLHKTRQGQRLAYGATVDAGKQRLGGAIGDPDPNSTPSDLSSNGIPKSDGGISKCFQSYDLRFDPLEKGVGDLPEGYTTRHTAITPDHHKIEAIAPNKSVAGSIAYHHYPDAKMAFIRRVDVAKKHRGKGLSEALYSSMKGQVKQDHPDVHTVTGDTINPVALRSRSRVFGKPSIEDYKGNKKVGWQAANRILTAPLSQRRPLGVTHTLKGVKVAMLYKAIEGGNWNTGQPSYLPPKPVTPRFKMTIPHIKTPSFKMPTFKQPKPAGSPASPMGKPAPVKPMTTPPVNHLDSGALADSIGGNLHDVQSRVVKPAFGKPQEQHAHLMSHTNPKKAIAALHTHLASQGKVGAVHEQRVPHADGGMGHLYSFEHTDHAGAKHIIHMMRSASPSVSLKPKNGASPLPHLAGASSPASPPPAAPSASSPPPSGFNPGHHMAQGAFESGMIAHHARAGTLPSDPKAREKMVKTAYSAHLKQHPGP